MPPLNTLGNQNQEGKLEEESKKKSYCCFLSCVAPEEAAKEDYVLLSWKAPAKNLYSTFKAFEQVSFFLVPQESLDIIVSQEASVVQSAHTKTNFSSFYLYNFTKYFQQKTNVSKKREWNYEYKLYCIYIPQTV